MNHSNGPGPKLAPIAPPTALLGLRDYNVNWPSFFARTVIRGAIMWPILRYVGGVQGGRALATAAVAGAGLTSLELAFDAAGILTLDTPAPPPIQAGSPTNTANSAIPGPGVSGWGPNQGFGDVIDVNGSSVIG